MVIESATPAAIEVAGLRVRRGRHEVLRGVDLSVEPGCVFGLLGPSGSGKTTLMRAIVGLQRVASGTVRVLGRPSGATGLAQRIGYMPQAPALYGDLSVAENLRYFARLTSQPPARVAEVAEEVDMSSFSRRRVDSLSGGQRARVSLALALLSHPDVLILDEPTVGLDPLLRERLWEGFRAKAAAGVSVVVSSHVMEEAARCDRLALLREGLVVASGSPAALLERTGAAEMNEAFIRLIEAAGREAA